jgi:hypothetical protein
VTDVPDGCGLSQHPVDRLIRGLIASGRAASRQEIAAIVDRMASAPFEPRAFRVPVRHRNLEYLGQPLGARSPSLSYHLVKRVLVERQWAVGTTEQQYLDDIRRAVGATGSRLAIYERQGGALAATVTRTAIVVPADRRGARSLPALVVIYSADRGIIVTGYQCSAISELSIPPEARWLR